MKTLKNLIDDINSGEVSCPEVSVQTDYKFGAHEIITDDFEVWYTYSASFYVDCEENPCFKETKSTIEVEISNVYDGYGEPIPYSEFEVELIDAIEINTKIC